MTDPDAATAPHTHAEGETPAAPQTLTERVRNKLGDAPAPLKFAEVKKGLTKAKKQSPGDFEAEIRRLLDEEVRDGRAFVYPSGKEGENRYWSRDEKHAIREEALRLAATPATLADLKKKAGAAAKGADPGFAEAVLRDLIAGDVLFEHPPKKPNGPLLIGVVKYRSPNDKPAVTEALLAAAETPLPLKDLVKAVVGTTKADKEFVGSVADGLIGAGQLHKHAPVKGKTPLYGRQRPEPPDPFKAAKVKTALAKLAESVKKLMSSAGVTAEDLFARLRSMLAHDEAARADSPGTAPADAPAQGAAPPLQHTEATPAGSEEMESLILKEVAHAPVLSLADLRRQMPGAYQGPEFDVAIIRLFDAQKVILYQDMNPARYTDAERAEFVRDEGGTLFTTISKRS